MVAKIDTNNRLDKTLNYNEQKVAQDTAELILSSGFLKDTNRLTFDDKFERFQRQNELNPNAKVNTLHAKVSFDSSEKLSNETLQRIAKQYMEGIGFGDQPYLVYRHNDTQVPHIHIVSTMITPEGKRIRDYNIGKDKSEPIRETIEKEFDLVRAKDHAQVEEYKYTAIDLEKVTHGEEPTKKAIENRLKTVLNEYNITSLSELNAILRGYNIYADQGEPGSRKRKHGGLTYSVQDDKGKTAGIPIKASEFSFKPTLDNLKKKFQADCKNRQHKVQNVRDRVANVLRQKPKSLDELVAQLRKEKIDVVVWSNDSGKTYGITFVDHDKKIAVKGSEMGKEFSAKSILTTIAQNDPENEKKQSADQKKKKGQQQSSGQSSPNGRTGTHKAPQPLPDGWTQPRPPRGVRPVALEVPEDHNRRSPHLLEQLLQSRSQGDNLPKELSQDRRKKKKRKQSF
jgi:hypothetical protein